MTYRIRVRRRDTLPRLPVELVAIFTFGAIAYFEVRTGGYTDFLLGFLMTILVVLAWAYRDDAR